MVLSTKIDVSANAFACCIMLVDSLYNSVMCTLCVKLQGRLNELMSQVRLQSQSSGSRPQTVMVVEPNVIEEYKKVNKYSLCVTCLYYNDMCCSV